MPMICMKGSRINRNPGAVKAPGFFNGEEGNGKNDTERLPSAFFVWDLWEG